MKKQYVYIGQYYHIGGKQIPTDYKFGVTDSLDNREYQLSRTKSPIKYMILRAWEIPMSVKRESVEKLIKWLFDTENYKGTEWYDIDGELFQDKITEFLELLTELVPNDDFRFINVNFDTKTPESTEERKEQEIRKKNASQNMKITLPNGDIILNKDFGGAAQSFIDSIKFLRKTISLEQITKDFPRICGKDLESFSNLKIPTSQLKEIDDMIVNTFWSTSAKSKHLKDMFNSYNNKIDIELFVNI
jgi:hypothetical protein